MNGKKFRNLIVDISETMWYTMAIELITRIIDHLYSQLLSAIEVTVSSGLFLQLPQRHTNKGFDGNGVRNGWKRREKAAGVSFHEGGAEVVPELWAENAMQREF